MLGLRGYIDESYDQSAVPKVFTLSCIVSFDNMWPWLEWAWQGVLDKKNKQLGQENRPLITRYHAVDCNGRRGEFKGWTPDERNEFSLQLFHVLRKHPIHIHSFDLQLQTLIKEIPGTKSSPIGFAYVILLHQLMMQISESTLSLYPNDVIYLHHDQSAYNGALKDAFTQMINDPGFKNRDRFISLTPESSRTCVPLQTADMIAYETFKEGMRQYFPNGKDRRKSLAAILDLDAVSGRAQGFGADAIRELGKFVSSLDASAKQALFNAARIKP